MSRKLMKFLIMFDNSNLLFFPGQFLTGRVILEVDDDMPVLGKSIFQMQYYLCFLKYQFFLLIYHEKKKIFCIEKICRILLKI